MTHFANDTAVPMLALVTEAPAMTKPTQTPAENRALLLEILSYARPHDSECELAFGAHFIDTVEGMQRDAFGNRYIKIGDTGAAWSCHIDTVARHGGPQRVKLNKASGTISLKDPRKKCSLGADDGTGIWIMLEMIRHNRPGLYIFHRGEERGCLGSSWIVKNTPELVDGIDFMMAFDRAGFEDVITHQASGKTASDEFAQSFADQLNTLGNALSFRPDDTGVYTDTNEYADLIAECSNLSVGYHHQHSKDETQNLYFAERVLAAMLELEVSGLVIAREPGDCGYSYSHSQSVYKHSWKPNVPDALEDMSEMCRVYPMAVAAILEDMGYEPDYLWANISDKLNEDAEARKLEDLSDLSTHELVALGIGPQGDDDRYADTRWDAA